MKQVLVFCSLICLWFAAAAQQEEFYSVDNLMRSVPAAFTHSTDSLALFVQANFKKDIEKFRAIYKWVTYNIRYDTDSMYVFNWGADPEKKVTSALRRRKGVCENFAAVFNEIAIKCGLQSFVVSGYTIQSGSVDHIGHSWCAVKVAENWLFCDPTWDENFTSDPKYFLIRPETSIATHIPFDPLWQLLDEQVSYPEFYKRHVYSGHIQKINAGEAVDAFLKMNERSRLQATASRIKLAGIPNELVKNNLAYIQMQIAIIDEDKYMNIYDAAVDALNDATTAMNDFIQYRNKQFFPEKTNAEIELLIGIIENKLSIAAAKASSLALLEKNVQYDTESLNDRINVLQKKLQSQKDFLKLYFASGQAERKKLFYN